MSTSGSLPEALFTVQVMAPLPACLASTVMLYSSPMVTLSSLVSSEILHLSACPVGTASTVAGELGTSLPPYLTATWCLPTSLKTHSDRKVPSSLSTTRALRGTPSGPLTTTSASPTPASRASMVNSCGRLAGTGLPPRPTSFTFWGSQVGRTFMRNGLPGMSWLA
uniref:Uncharacterized protein n=1 Tax=Ixodes ricinus TaxID=34613 RepID=A0A6B0UXG4_IXORI